MLDRLPRGFINHIELWLSAVALVLIFGIPALAGPEGLAFWRLTAVIAIAVGSVHGVIFWVVRRRQRQIRRRSIQEIQTMLADVVKNRLAAIEMALPQNEDPEMVRQEVEAVREGIREIATHVDNLSVESLKDWEARYEGVLERTREESANR